MKPILLVDDDDFFLGILTRNIKQAGFAIMKSTCISEAKEILQNTKPLLICSDLNMSDGSGFELLDYVQENMPEIPFIVMSIYQREDFSDEATRKGAICSISKSEYSKSLEIIMDFANQALPMEERLFCHRILYLCSDFQRGVLLQKELLKQKYHVMIVRSLLGAIEKLLDGMEIELILCDSDFPEKEILEFLKKLRKDTILQLLCKKIPPCIMLMQEGSSIAKEVFFQEGVYECISAPADTSKVSLVLQDYFKVLQK